jgi:hypothetical protein
VVVRGLRIGQHLIGIDRDLIGYEWKVDFDLEMTFVDRLDPFRLFLFAIAFHKRNALCGNRGRGASDELTEFAFLLFVPGDPFGASFFLRRRIFLPRYLVGADRVRAAAIKLVSVVSSACWPADSISRVGVLRLRGGRPLTSRPTR